MPNGGANHRASGIAAAKAGRQVRAFALPLEGHSQHAVAAIMTAADKSTAGFPVERDAVLQLVTVIVGVIVGLTFLFGFGRHEALLLRMEVEDRPSLRRRSGGVKLEAA